MIDKEMLEYCIKQLEKMSDIPDCSPENYPGEPDEMMIEEITHKAIHITAACAVIRENYYKAPKTPDIDGLGKIIEKIEKRILSITDSDLPYPTSEEVIDAGKKILKAHNS